MKPQISVVIPIYGDFDSKRLELVLKACKNQKGIDLEAVVSEQNLEPQFEAVARKLEVTYVHTLPELAEDKTPLFNTGLVRNEGVQVSSGNFLYLTDADIVFIDKEYLLHLTRLSKESNFTLIKPPMVRLLKPSFEKFYWSVQHLGVTSALLQLDLSGYVTYIGPNNSKLRIIQRKNRTLTISEDFFEKFKADSSLRLLAPTLFYDTAHIGGIFVPRQRFDSVVGYCERFYKWGYEDSDLQWKLAQIASIEEIPSQARFKVLHLDHPKSYFCPEQNEINRTIAEVRMQEQILEIIRKDLECGKSNYVQSLRGE